MTMIWDEGSDVGTVLPFTPLGTRNNRTISWCEADGIYARIYSRDDGAGNTLFCYAYGNTNAWTEEILIRSNLATGRLGVQATVTEFSLCVDQTGGANDHVHIVWIDSTTMQLYHSELVIPNAPNLNPNWTAWGGLRYQRVDNNSDSNYPSVDTDNNGHPVVAYEVAQGGGQYQVYVNYGNGAAHAFAPAAELSISANIGHNLYPALICIHEDNRDIYVFVNNLNLIQCNYCDKAGLPTAAPSWGGWNTILTFAGLGQGNADAPSVYYWYEPGAALAQIMVVAREQNLGVTRDDWYDEGNVNGWGGGWRAAPNGTLEGPVCSTVQMTQVDANDFALTYIQQGGSVIKFAFTDYGTTYDFIGASVRNATNLLPTDYSTEERGRENDDFSYGNIHVQAGAPDLDFMYDLIRANAKPTATTLDPDGGSYEDEQADFDLTWTFSDPGQAQTKFRVQIAVYGTSFAAPVVDTTTVSAVASHTVDAFTLSFGTHYEWRLKVWDNELGDEYDPYSESDWVS